MKIEEPQAPLNLEVADISTVNGGDVAPDAKTPFKYGWCKTDHKDGKEIRQYYRQTDYMNDEPYATRLHAMLDQLGLPKPKAEEVFRGTHHDLLFLDSHGVVVRIGPTDVEDLMNPGIVQPLGWIEDKENMISLSNDYDGSRKVPFTVAIYPGIELNKHYEAQNEKTRPPVKGDINNLLKVTKQGDGDLNENNLGVIRVLDDDGQEIAVKMLLDADNEWNSSSRELSEKRGRQFESETKAVPNKGEALMNTLHEVFNAASDVKYFEKAFEVHQPLRQMFWDAFDKVEAVTGLPDEKKRDAFWQKCAAVTNRPTAVTLPVWKMKDGPSDSLSLSRRELHVPSLVLYRPWTGEEADRIIKPIKQTPEFKDAVRRAHAQAFRDHPVRTVVNAGRGILNRLMPKRH
ncbi:MAG: hypothetical protein GC185_01985 [Alphaproteobacteria bacterium]|nr:hypothetical protein [Alphaproteobacteria bacterium]